MVYKSGIKDIIDILKKERAQCEQVLRICEEAIKKSLRPQSVWLQEKEKVETRMEDIDRSLALFKKYV